jgi:putative endopeptidase
MFAGGRPESHDARLVYALYHLSADWDARNALGVAPLKEIVDRIEAISSVDELTAYFTEAVDGEPRKKLWTSFSTIDPVHTDRHIIMVNLCGLLRGDSAEYADPTPEGEDITARYIKFAEYLLVRTGYSEEEAQQKVENCLKLEEMLSPVIPTRKERMDPDFQASQNKYVTRDELQKVEGNIPVLEELENAQGFPAREQYMLPCPEFFEKLNEIYNTAVVDEIIEAYHDVLNNTEWISDETRRHALEKLDSIDRRVLFPDSWEEYDYEVHSRHCSREAGF